MRPSSDHGATWSTPQLLTSFDFADGPVARGYFVGDYQGLAPIGALGLLGFFGVTETTPQSANVISIRRDRGKDTVPRAPRALAGTSPRGPDRRWVPSSPQGRVPERPSCRRSGPQQRLGC